MLARREIPLQYKAWNGDWAAPYGRRGAKTLRERLASRLWDTEIRRIRRLGMFAFQPNNDTRIFEYPWAFHSGRLASGMRALEVGGGLSGFQFTLSREGISVDNVDPGMEELGWPIDETTYGKLNAAFKTDTRLLKTSILDVNLAPNSYDRAFSISVIEHFPTEHFEPAIRQIHAALKPGGLFVLTVDLFLDLHPFSDKQQNHLGRNIALHHLVRGGLFDLLEGDKSELFGFPEFRPQDVMEKLPELLMGSMHPVLVQTMVLRKR